MKFTLKNAFKIGWDGLTGYAYNNGTDFANASAACFEVTDKGHGKVKTTHSDRIYYVLEGSGQFIVSGEAEAVQASDVVIVPKDTPYDYKADKDTILKLFLVHTPAFDPTKEVQL